MTPRTNKIQWQQGPHHEKDSSPRCWKKEKPPFQHWDGLSVCWVLHTSLASCSHFPRLQLEKERMIDNHHICKFCFLVDVAIVVSHLLAFEIRRQEIFAIVVGYDRRNKIEALRKVQSMSFIVESVKQRMVEVSRYVCKMNWRVRFESTYSSRS